MAKRAATTDFRRTALVISPPNRSLSERCVTFNSNTKGGVVKLKLRNSAQRPAPQDVKQIVRKRKDEGIALILALLVLVILVVVILQMTASSLHNRTLAENHLADLQNTYGARAGYQRALIFLQLDLEKAPE